MNSDSRFPQLSPLGQPQQSLFPWPGSSGSSSRKGLAREIHLDKCLPSVKWALLLLQTRHFQQLKSLSGKLSVPPCYKKDQPIRLDLLISAEYGNNVFCVLLSIKPNTLWKLNSLKARMRIDSEWPSKHPEVTFFSPQAERRKQSKALVRHCAPADCCYQKARRGSPCRG